MDTNKKITNGWILCPSKSFPGKFYYFNVINGETAWCLNEADKKSLKRDINIQKIANKSHSYPEPTSPPVENIPNSSNIGPNIKKSTPNISQTYTNNAKSFKIQHPTPMFGQAIFPKSLASQIPYTPNIFWTPIQIPVPMFIAPELEQPTTDQITQKFELDRELFVHTCNKPLCQHFKNYESPVINFNKDNIVENRSVFNKFFQTSTPIKSKPNDNQLNELLLKQLNFENNNNNMQIKHSQCSNYPTAGESEMFQPPFSNIEKNILNPAKTPTLDKNDTFQNFTIHNTTNCFERHQTNLAPEICVGSTQTSKSTFDFSKPTLTPTVRVDSSMAKKELNVLDENDLRMLLVARKRKSNTDTVLKSGSNEGKRARAIIEEKTCIPKKKVSFNFDNLSYEEIDTMTENYQDLQYDHDNVDNLKKPTIEYLKNLAAPSMKSDCWYIVVDTDILLEDFEFINNFVQTVQSSRHEEDISDILTIDSILNCCVAAIEGECHVVLVTNDTNLYNRAKSINIPSYKLQDIKDHIANAKYKVSFDIKKINNCVEYGTEHLTQDMNRVPVHTFKKQLFINYKVDNKKQGFTQLDTLTEAHKSTVNSDKLINITKLKFPQTNQTRQNKNSTTKHGNDVTETAIEIDRDLQKLNLKEKQNLFQIKKEVRNNKPSQSNLFNLQRNAKPIALYSHRKNENLNWNYDEGLVSNTTVSFYFRNEGTTTNINQTAFDFRHTRNGNQTPTLQNFNTTKGVRNKIDSLGSHQVSDSNQTVSIFFQKDGNTNQKKSTVDFPKEIQRSIKTKDPKEFDIQEYSEKEKQPASNNGLAKLININGLGIEECLNGYYVKNKTMEQRLKARMDEWICSYRQIMEEALSDILQKFSSSITKEMSPPWSLYEAVQCIKNVYGDHQSIKVIVDKLCPLLVDSSDKIKSNINPEDFMKIIGCSILLIQHLKIVLPKLEVLVETENSLKNILHNIEDLTIEPQLPSILKTPVISRSEVAETNQEARRNFVKTPTDIINYLKKHYEQWSSYNEVTEDIKKQRQNPQIHDVKIVRTFGKSLNLLKIDNTKSMTMNQPIDKNLYVMQGNAFKQDTSAVPKTIRLFHNLNSSLNDDKGTLNNNTIRQTQKTIDEPKVIRTIENINPNLIDVHNKITETDKNSSEIAFINRDTAHNLDSNAERKVVRLIENIKHLTKNQIKQKEPANTVAEDEYNYTTHENTFDQNKEHDGRKVVRNVQLIAIFEEKMKKKAKEPLDLDVLDYSEINQSLSDITNDDFSEQTDKNNHYADNNNPYVENNDQYLKNNDKNTPITKKDFNEYTDQVSQNQLTVKNNNCVQNNDSLSPNDSYATTNDNYKNNYAGNNDHFVENNDRLTVEDDVTNDSGFENESLHAHSLVKSFLIELSSSFKIIFKFIDRSITEFRNESLCYDKKKLLQDKANKTHSHITEIIVKLKSIIIRETNEGTTLKALLIKAGVQVSTDKRMTRYRQVVTKCLEQAQMLQNALKSLLAVIDGDYDAVLTEDTKSMSCNIRYFNIFE